MTAEQIIREIEVLSTEEQAKVVRFAYRLDAERQLNRPGVLERMVDSTDPVQTTMLWERIIIRGFYGSGV